MMCQASASDARVQFLKLLVKPGKVLLTNCGISTAYHIYQVKSDPGRFPDVVLPIKIERPYTLVLTRRDEHDESGAYG